jgi:hypothetical protein
MSMQVATPLQKAKDRSANTMGPLPRIGIVLNACAAARLRLGASDCAAVELLSTQIFRKQAKALFSYPTKRHVACNVVINAFQQYERLASLATAKLERRWLILELAHPPLE